MLLAPKNFIFIQYSPCMKRYFLLGFLCSFISLANAQQYALFNTKTLFDSFENPAQTSFTLDSSRQYASNFFIPYLDLSSLNKGNSKEAINKLIGNGYNNTRVGAFNSPQTMRENINIYLISLRIFKYHKYHSEMGFSWQIKADTEVDYDKNISLGLFDTFSSFATLPRVNVFNNNFKLNAYHQISFNYRENYTKRWALGVKLSLLSGLGYTEFNADKSIVNINPATKQMSIQMSGSTNFNYPEDDSFSISQLLPFKNLGTSISLGTTYSTKSGIFMMGNIKDLGFIRWNGKSNQATFSEVRTFDNVTNQSSYKKETDNIGRESRIQKSFIKPINSRADFLISKTFGAYTPSLIITKNIFNTFGEAALVNTIKSGAVSFSAIPSYNLDNRFKLGMQGMLQTPNFEMFLGTNDLIQTYYTSKDLIKNNDGATGYNRGSVYLGMAFKIGYVVEHPSNMSWMPKVGSDKDRKSIFKKIFGIFNKKE